MFVERANLKVTASRASESRSYVCVLTFKGLQTCKVGQTHDSLGVSGPHPAGFSSELNISEALPECRRSHKEALRFKSQLWWKQQDLYSLTLSANWITFHSFSVLVLVHLQPKPSFVWVFFLLDGALLSLRASSSEGKRMGARCCCLAQQINANRRKQTSSQTSTQDSSYRHWRNKYDVFKVDYFKHHLS